MRRPTHPTDTASWRAFAAEAAALRDRDPDQLSHTEMERLEALSDPLVHLAAHARADTCALPDGVIASLAREREDGQRVLHARDRRRLRERILASLRARDFRVHAVSGPPPLRPLDDARPLSVAMLLDAERRREAPAPRELSIAAGGGRELWEAECDTVVPLPPEVPSGQYVALRVAGDSMEPLIHAGDTVLVKLHTRAAAGDVVVARDPDHGYVVKTLGPTTARGIELRSLNPAYSPMLVPRASDAVLGPVLLRWCAHTPPSNSR